uniref:Putative secreted protein n=1 Tax=Anopheles darlingi TaxID=43151 RepID=A0A2M4DP44_ANODA
MGGEHSAFRSLVPTSAAALFAGLSRSYASATTGSSNPDTISPVPSEDDSDEEINVHDDDSNDELLLEQQQQQYHQHQQRTNGDLRRRQPQRRRRLSTSSSTNPGDRSHSPTVPSRTSVSPSRGSGAPLQLTTHERTA